MNSRERVMAVLNGEKTDRRAFVPILNLYGARLIGATMERYYRDPALYASGQAAILESFRPDILLSPLFYAGEGEAFGANLKFFPDQPPNIRKYPVSSADEFLELEFPDIDSQPTLQYIRESLRLTVERCNSDIPVASILLNPIDLPSMVLGMDAWLDALLFKSDLHASVFNRTIDHFVAYGNALLADGASLLVSSGGFLSSTVVTRDLVEKVVMPVLKKAFAQIDGPIVIHNGGSSILPFMDLYKDLPNVVALYANAGDDLAKARRMIGDDIGLVGGMDGPSLDRFTPDEIYRRYAAILGDRREDPGFMLGTTGPDIPFDTPPENILAMIRAIDGVKSGNV
ncbi:uroporphyrinogen decarboxylase family protein [Methanooceanicella nereidis]